MYQSYKMDLAGRPLVVDINRVGKQAKRMCIHALW